MHPVPKVSVIIPSYNQASLLEEAVSSVLAQTFKDYELIIVDNHSVDNTPKLMEAHLNDIRVQYIRNDQTIPMHQNWTKGLRYPRGQYLKILCSDDVLAPTALEHMVAAMDQHPEVSVVSCGRKYIGDKDRVFVLDCAGKFDGKETVLNTLRTYNWLAAPSTVMLRTRNFMLTGGFGNYRWITDWDMWIRHLLLGDYFAIPEVLVFERVHNGSVTRSFNMNMVKLSEEYELFRKVRDGDYGYEFKEYKKELDFLMRRKVMQCAGYMYTRIPKLRQKKDREAFFKMLAIVKKEKLLLSSLIDLVEKKSRKLVMAKESGRLAKPPLPQT